MADVVSSNPGESRRDAGDPVSENEPREPEPWVDRSRLDLAVAGQKALEIAPVPGELRQRRLRGCEVTEEDLQRVDRPIGRRLLDLLEPDAQGPPPGGG